MNDHVKSLSVEKKILELVTCHFQQNSLNKGLTKNLKIDIQESAVFNFSENYRLNYWS